MRSAPSYRAPNPAHILLVDDNQDGILARRSVLQELGYTVVSAKNGVDALQSVEQQQFDLIVTDYKMPSMNGLELIAHLRKKGFDKPIILLSGYADTLGLRSEATGANVVIQKSANEITHLMRSAKRLLSAPKKPPASQRAAKEPSARKTRGGSSGD
jgi:CheY-like chemotaxis protein